MTYNGNIFEELIDEQEKLKILLVSNFGRMKNSPIKQSRAINDTIPQIK